MLLFWLFGCLTAGCVATRIDCQIHRCYLVFLTVICLAGTYVRVVIVCRQQQIFEILQKREFAYLTVLQRTTTWRKFGNLL